MLGNAGHAEELLIDQFKTPAIYIGYSTRTSVVALKCMNLSALKHMIKFILEVKQHTTIPFKKDLL